MKKAHAIALLALAVIVSVLILLLRAPDVADVPPRIAQSSGNDATRGNSAQTPPAANRSTSDQNLRAQAFAILSSPDDVDRMLRFCRLINGLTAAQCEEVQIALRLQEKHEGRVRDREGFILKMYLEAARPRSGDLTRRPMLSAAALHDPVVAIREILGLPGEFEKMLLLCEFLPRLDASNWKAITDAAWDVNTQEGESFLGGHRIRHLMERVGQTVGREAIEELVQNKIRQVHNTLVGWASAQPAAASEWVNGRSPDEQRKYLNALVAGVATSDPMRAATLLSRDFPPEDRSFLGYTLVESTLTVWGFQAAEEVFLGWKRTLPGDTSDTDLAFLTLARVRAMMSREAGSEEAKRLLDWLQPHLPYGMKGAHDVIATAGRFDPQATLSWTASHAGMMDAKFSHRVHASVARTWKRNAPEAFAVWVAQHANEPIAALMTEAVVKPAHP